MNGFSQECRQPEFAITDYLAKLTKGNGNGGVAASETGGTRAWQ
jgi:hypothetical protein